MTGRIRTIRPDFFKHEVLRYWRMRGGRYLYDRAEVLDLMPRVVVPGRKGSGP